MTGMRDAVVNGKTGYIVPRGDVVALADALKRTSEVDHAVALGMAALERVVAGYSDTIVNEQFRSPCRKFGQTWKSITVDRPADTNAEQRRSMKVLVTGGAGFIGSNLCRRLVEERSIEKVTVIDDLSTGFRSNLDGLPVDFRSEASILDAHALARASSDANAIVHLAALGSVPRSVKDPATIARSQCDGYACRLGRCSARSPSNACGSRVFVVCVRRQPDYPQDRGSTVRAHEPVCGLSSRPSSMRSRIRSAMACLCSPSASSTSMAPASVLDMFMLQSSRHLSTWAFADCPYKFTAMDCRVVILRTWGRSLRPSRGLFSSGRRIVPPIWPLVLGPP